MSGQPDILNTREQRLQDVLVAYMEADDAGWAPDCVALSSLYPDLATDLNNFFAFQAKVIALANPLHATNKSHETADKAKDACLAPSNSRQSTPMFQTGTDIGDYKLHEKLGGGGMGDVFRAWQKGAKSWVALKVVKPGRLRSREEVARFHEEIEAVAHLDHPHIVKIYHVSQHEGVPFFTMKLFENGSVQDKLAHFTQDHRASARLVANVARAVHHAHQRGILHRDLKPGNILLDAQERPYVADFGLAKRMNGAPVSEREPESTADTSLPRGVAESVVDVADSAAAQNDDAEFSYLAPEEAEHTISYQAPGLDLTVAGTTIGTVGYLPPEQVRIAKEGVSTAADVYGLGGILYAILTGKPPFRGKDRGETLHQVLEDLPTPPRHLNPRVDRALEAVCLKCLAKLPANRYASAEALAEDLERWLSGAPPLAWHMPWPRRAWHAARRHLLIGLLFTFLGFALAAMFFVLYYFNPDRVPNALVEAAKGRRVVLIGDKGHPAWSRWDVGAGTAIISPAVEKPFSFTSFEKARLELLPRAPGPRFRFSAEIKHEGAGENAQGVVGLYFARSQKVTNDGPTTYWWDLTFADRGDHALKHDGPDQRKHSEVRLIPRRYAATQGYFDHPADVFERFVSAQANFAKSDWRKLAVNVTPDLVEFSWEGAPFKKLSPAQMRKLGEPFVVGGANVFPEIEFNPEGGLGLFLSKGTASFCRVIVEPLE